MPAHSGVCAGRGTELHRKRTRKKRLGGRVPVRCGEAGKGPKMKGKAHLRKGHKVPVGPAPPQFL